VQGVPGALGVKAEHRNPGLFLLGGDKDNPETGELSPEVQ
jgi:hypothetical protein